VSQDSSVSLVRSAGGIGGQLGLGYLARAQSAAAGYLTGGLAMLLAVPPLLLLRSRRERADAIVGRRLLLRSSNTVQGMAHRPVYCPNALVGCRAWRPGTRNTGRIASRPWTCTSWTRVCSSRPRGRGRSLGHGQPDLLGKVGQPWRVGG